MIGHPGPLTRSVLSGICGWLVRRGALAVNPVRDLTPLELDRDRTARAMSIEELRAWLASWDFTRFATSPLPFARRIVPCTATVPVARMIADRLVSTTQDAYLGRRAGNAANPAALEAYNPDLPLADPGPGEGP